MLPDRDAPANVFALSLLALALASTACRGRAPVEPDPLAGIAIDACTLFTEADAERALGIDMARMERAIDARQGVREAKCSYGLAAGGPAKVVSLDLRRFRSREEAKLQGHSLSLLRTVARGEVQQIADLGDEAWWFAREIRQLHVQDGNMRIIISVELGPEERQMEVAKTIAAGALERLHDEL